MRARALMRGDSNDVVNYLAEHHKLLGLVKAERKRHRENAALCSLALGWLWLSWHSCALALFLGAGAHGHFA